MVALGGGLCARLPMALVRELIRQRRRDLHLVGSAHSIDVDLLVAAGAVRVCEESYVGFEQDLGLAPAFRRAAQTGDHRGPGELLRHGARPAARRRDGAAVPAGARGEGHRDGALHPEYGTVRCPFTGEELVAVPPLTPDVALLHAPLGDRHGNLHLDQPYVLDERFAAASRMVVATVDRLAPTAEVAAAGVVVPAHTVAAVVEVPFGAHPSSCYPGYAYDRAHLAEYVAAAGAGARRAGVLPRPVRAGTPGGGVPGARRRATRLAGLAGWKESTERGRSCSVSWSIDEWFVVALARTIRDREVVFHGFASPCAQVAMHVARRTPARGDACWSRARRTRWTRTGVHPADQQRPRAAPGRRVPDAVRGVLRRRGARRRRPDVPVRRADRRLRQHERHGDRAAGRSRRSSSAAAGAAATSRRRSATSPCGRPGTGPAARWCREVDFLTDIGHVTPEGTRAELGYTGGGPEWLVTELGLFDYAPDGHARLRAVFPDVDVADVEAATGFELRVDLAPSLLPPPSGAELAAVRSLDPLGVRRLEFAAEELKRHFSHCTHGACAC